MENRPEPHGNTSPENIRRLCDWARCWFEPGCYLGDICRQETWDFSDNEVFALEMAYEGFSVCRGLTVTTEPEVVTLHVKMDN